MRLRFSALVVVTAVASLIAMGALRAVPSQGSYHHVVTRALASSNAFSLLGDSPGWALLSSPPAAYAGDTPLATVFLPAPYWRICFVELPESVRPPPLSEARIG